MSRRIVHRPEGRHRINVVIDGLVLSELDRLAAESGRDRSHQIEALVRAELGRGRKRKP